MATKTRQIVIERRGASHAPLWLVWTDTPSLIAALDGVVSVSDEPNSIGAYVVKIDPRYDCDELQAEMEALSAWQD